MTKTSITDYIVGGIMASCVIAVFIFFYVNADINYDIGDVDTSGLEKSYGNLSQMVINTNNTVSGIYDINADASLYDVLGGLAVKALSAIKSFISGISFVTKNINKMLGSGFLHIPLPITMAIVATIGVLIGGVFLFKFIARTDDEK